MYTLHTINDNWFLIDNKYYENTIVIDEITGYDISSILNNISLFVSKYKTTYQNNIAVNENKFEQMMAAIKKSKISGIKPSEYVANKVGYNYKSNDSFYDNSTEIEIEDNGIIHKGLIRISDHEIALNNWALNNPNYDFGISFIIKETPNSWNGSNLVNVPNRTIIIYEYTYLISRKNFDFLNHLIFEIISIKQSKFYNVGKPILGKAPNIVKNSSLHEKLISAIKLGIKKTLNH